MSISLFYIFPIFLIVNLCGLSEQNICGGIFLNDNGEIKTPNYPNSYPQHLICSWNISVAQNYSILLEFEDFYTDKTDYLNVFDVINNKLSLRGRFSGRNHPQHLISTQNNLFMNLSTTSARKGFKLLYKTIDKCGGVYKSHSQIISSPGYSKSYFENTNCYWTIVCPGNRTINVKFLDIHLEDDHAFLTISDASSNILANLTGSKPQNMLLTKSNKLFLNFKTDKSLNSKGYRGFSIAYTTLVVGSELSFIISTTNAIITTNQNQTIDNIIYNSVNEYTIVEYDIYKRKLILFDPESKQLFLDYSMIKSVAINAKRDGMAYDWVHSLIYWLDTQNKFIYVTDSNDLGSYSYSICELNDQNQRDLVINVNKSELVWSQIGFEPKLWRIGSDGSNKNVLYSNWRQAFHLTVDYEIKRYYFVDITDFSLFSIDFNGNNENRLITSKSFFDSITSMTSLNSHLYLTNNQIIYKISDLNLTRAEILFTSGNRHEFIENENFYDFKSLDIKRPQIYNFKIIDSILQPNVTNRCLVTKCDALCLPTTKSYRCLRNTVTTSAPLVMNSESSGKSLAIFNMVLIVILVVLLVLLYFGLKQLLIKLENKIFQVLVPTVSFRKSRDSKHEYENHHYEEPVYKINDNRNQF